MVMVADDFDVKNYYLVANEVDDDNDILSMMLPKPEMNFLNYIIILHLIGLFLVFTFLTNSSACSAALCASAPKSISSDNTPALSTSVIYK